MADLPAPSGGVPGRTDPGRVEELPAGVPTGLPAGVPTGLPAGGRIIGTHGPIGPLRGLVTISGRLVLGAPRGQGLPSIDVVEFTATCPACGHDVQWIEEREETRLRIIIECPCTR